MIHTTYQLHSQIIYTNTPVITKRLSAVWEFQRTGCDVIPLEVNIYLTYNTGLLIV